MRQLAVTRRAERLHHVAREIAEGRMTVRQMTGEERVEADCRHATTQTLLAARRLARARKPG
jgi:hypothetical protein